MLITQESIDNIRDISISSIIGNYIALKGTGRVRDGLCPFHNDKNLGSFKVDERKGRFTCYSCGASGDGIEFMQKHLQLSFIQAVESIARIGGITLKYQNNGKSAEDYAAEQTRRDNVYTTLSAANQIFRAAYPCVESYFQDERMFPAEVANLFGLGYCDGTLNNNQGFNQEALQNAGLILRQEGKAYDFLKYRLTIPLHDEMGRICGISGRIMPQYQKYTHAGKENERPKYKNPIETPTYRKEQFLYGLFQARKAIKEKGYAIVTEGYFNVIRGHCSGVENIVATCGTALTEGQAKILQRHTKKILLCVDGDLPGYKATLRAIEILVPLGFDVKIFQMPNEKDFDDFGREKYKQTINGDTGEITENDIIKLVSHRPWLSWANLYVNKFIDSESDNAYAEYYRRIGTVVAKIPDPISRKILIDSIPRNKEMRTIRAAIIEVVKEGNRKEKEHAQQKSLLTGVLLDEDGTSVINKRGAMQSVCEFHITLRYQLIGREKNDCDWVMQLTKGEEVKFLRIPNTKLHSARSLKTIFSNARVELSIDDTQLDYLINHLLKNCKEAETVRNLGWYAEAKLWFFANTAYDPSTNDFLKPNELSIVERQNKAYYMPYADTNNKPNKLLRAFSYEPSPITFTYMRDFIRKSWGDAALLVLGFEVASWFKDYLAPAANAMQPFFPILFIQGTPSSGKSTLARVNSRFYGKDIATIPLKQQNTRPGIAMTMQTYSNVAVPFEDYGSPEGKNWIGEITGIATSYWELNLYVKMDIRDMESTESYDANGTMKFTANYPPMDSSLAFQTRLIYLYFSKSAFGQAEMESFQNALNYMADNSLTPALTEVLKYRGIIEAHFQTYFKNQIEKLLAISTGYPLPSRTIQGYAMITAVMLILNDKTPATWGVEAVQLNEIVRGVMLRHYNSILRQSPITRFWETVQRGYEAGILIYNVHFRIEKETICDDNGVILEDDILVVAFRLNKFFEHYVKECKSMGYDYITDGMIASYLDEDRAALKFAGKNYGVRKSFRFAPEDAPEGARTFVTTAIALRYEYLKQDFGIDLVYKPQNI